ncbi:uncharacterized protein A1O5_04490 [Cladophialophora psammophila CBS 110553]|uniref:Major facilitator superfamily (MFS) profile domain-containing protein n=1 Tax=Cladophialophora psammophila CBS 110553 TaxID=1182543 RepID=W9WUW8_9EURO|nr:uncharacterized protein A1O5_04490 [Cladophialophora psammophila CBS 110553]EXJ71987.1 hypothetical protein A1O5_04490 [Cladophialophora psammophila CBS 110553]
MNKDVEKTTGLDQWQETTQHYEDETSKPRGAEEAEFAGVGDEKPHIVKGDDSDGHVNWSKRQILATLSLSGLYVGSQLPLLLGAGSLPFIIKDIGGSTVDSWFPVAYSLTLASVSPFSGYLQDVFGRRNISLVGGCTLCVGIIVVATSHTMAQAIVGMALSGLGAAIGELTALAGTSELVPVKKRGLYLGAVTGCVLPFSPYAIYTTLLGTHSTWRWGFWIPLIWNGLAVIGIALTYWPHSQLRAERKTFWEILPQIDFIGGLLSTGGLTLFLVGVTAGGTLAPWASARVLCPLLFGIGLIVVFAVWEWKFATFPMLPHELFAGQRVVAMSFLVAFISGIYFYALLNFGPIIYLDLYNPDPVKAGIKGVIISLGVTAGAVLPNMLLSYYRTRNREILAACAVLTTAFGTALVTATPDNPIRTVAFCTISGFGVGAIVACALTTAVTAAPDNIIATCVALSLSIRTVGGSVGTAVNSNIFDTKLKKFLPTYIAKYAMASGLPASSATAFVQLYLTAPGELTDAAVPGLTAAVMEGAAIGARWAYAESLKYVWYTMLPFGILSCAACLGLGNVGKFMTNRIAANIRH